MIQALHVAKHLCLEHEVRIYSWREFEARGAVTTERSLWLLLLLLLQIRMLPWNLLLACLLREELLGALRLLLELKLLYLAILLMVLLKWYLLMLGKLLRARWRRQGAVV